MSTTQTEQQVPVKAPKPNDVIANAIYFVNHGMNDKFYKLVEDYKNSLVTTSPIRWKIERYLKEKPVSFFALSQLPHNVRNLLSVENVSKIDNVFLSEKTEKFVNELVLEWQSKDALAYHNIPARNKILLHGPTGNGKTLIAKYIAKLANLPFVEINADNVIESKLGSSGGNINAIFKEINEPSVIFWDEVDTIGRQRGSNTESAAGVENERMVNSMLVNIDKLNPNAIFIGATNRKSILDSAFLRRFDTTYEMEAPTDSQKIAFSDQLLEYYNLAANKNVISDAAVKGCVSYSEIKTLLLNQARQYVIEKLSMPNKDF